MRTAFVIILLVLSVASYAQSPFEKTFPLAGAKELVATFDNPDVTIQTWNKNEVLVKGTISINNGENDSAFDIETTNTNGVLNITSIIKDKDNLPRHIVIKKGDQEFTFRAKSFDDPEIQKFFNEHGRDYSYMTNGLLLDIKLTVFVPENLKTTIDARNGIVEFKSFSAPLRILAKNGKVDATIPSSTGSLVARTKNGEILSNLDIKFDQQPFGSRENRGDKWTEVSAHPGNGPDLFIEAKNGTIYLRKP